MIAELFEKLHPENFIVCFNFCQKNLTRVNAKKYIDSAIYNLTKEGRKKFESVPIENIYLVPWAAVDQVVGTDRYEDRVYNEISLGLGAFI